MSPEILVVIGAALAAALITGLGVFLLLDRFSPERRRLDQIASPMSGSVALPLDTPLLRDERSALEDKLAQWVPRSPKEMGRLQRQLAMAGYHGYLPAAVYAIAEVALPALVAVTVLMTFGLGAGLIFALIGAAMAYLVPGLVLSRIIRNYKKEIRNGLPDALDLLIVCVEAGSGLDQALLKASEELAVSYPRLSDEVGMITTEIRAGKPRLDAFKNFADRTKVDDVQSLVSMLVQTDRFGTSVSQALRTYADVLRTKRRQRAEEKAAKLGVKLVFPLVLCLFPALYAVTLGPAVIQFKNVFLGEVMGR